MGRKLRSIFKPVTARPGSGERPVQPLTAPGGGTLDGVVAGTVVESGPPAGGSGVAGGSGLQTPTTASAQEAKTGATHDEVCRLAYERWLETGGGEVENWVWAEAELRRRASADGRS